MKQELSSEKNYQSLLPESVRNIWKSEYWEQKLEWQQKNGSEQDLGS